MISLSLAQQLKEAGLVWQTTPNDFFGIPDRDLDDQIFVLSEIQAQTDIFRGWPVVTFHGASEWALDYILSHEVVWMPREEQLRDAIFSYLPAGHDASIQLHQNGKGATLLLNTPNGDNAFEGKNASEAYGLALLYVIQSYSQSNQTN